MTSISKVPSSISIGYRSEIVKSQVCVVFAYLFKVIFSHNSIRPHSRSTAGHKPGTGAKSAVIWATVLPRDMRISVRGPIFSMCRCCEGKGKGTESETMGDQAISRANHAVDDDGCCTRKPCKLRTGACRAVSGFHHNYLLDFPFFQAPQRLRRSAR